MKFHLVRMSPIEFKSEKVSSAAWEKFRGFRSQEKFFDVTINVDGVRFQAHKLILSACSEYFETMFLSSFRESKQAEITLKDISTSAFSTILDYCYNETITIDSENVQDVLAVGSIMQVTEVQQFCADFMERGIDTTNCLGFLNTADQYNLTELYKVALEFTLDKFREVVEDPDSEFALLDVGLLTKLLQHDRLNVDDEVNIFKAVIKWLSSGDEDERMKSVDALLPLIRFPLMEPKSLVNLKRIVDELNLSTHLQVSEIFRDLVDEAKDYHLLKNCYPSEKSRTAGDRFRERIPALRLKQRIFAVGGWTNEYKPIANVEKYNPYVDKWEFVSPMSSPRCGVGVAIIGNSLYAVGGHDGQNYLKSVERYNIEDGTWYKDVADMHAERTSVGVVALNGYIYAIGGQANNTSGDPNVSALSNVERYDPSTNKWEKCARLRERRLGAGVAVLNGLIYVVGGAFHGPSNSVERYDPAADKWTFVCSMRKCRKHLGCTSSGGYIIAAGGRDSLTELNDVEAYCPKRDKWLLHVPMNKARSGIGLVELDDCLYCVGGHDGHFRLTLVECYDPKTTYWTDKTSLNQERLGGGLAVYSQLPEL